MAKPTWRNVSISRHLTASHNSLSFSNRNQPIYGEILERFRGAFRPANFEIDSVNLSQSEMQSAVADGVKTVLGYYGLHLLAVTIANLHRRPDRTAIRRDPDQFDFQPVVIGVEIVSQQGRGLVQVYDENIDITVVIVVAESGATAGVNGIDAGPGLSDQLLESAFS